MKISRSALLPYSADNMFSVVSDINSYPDFLNWCSAAEIISETSTEVVAKLVIAYRKLDFSFVTCNQMEPGRSIKMSLVKGPFSDLSGEWCFTELNHQACKVALEMNFEFDNPVAHKVFSGVFHKVISAQLEAFQKRADNLFGG